MIHPLRRVIRGAPPLLGSLLAACAAISQGPAPDLPRRAFTPEAFLNRLAADGAAARTLRGLASVRYDGPAGQGSATQAIVVALPDRARFEVLSPLGTAVLLLTIRGDDLAVFAPARQEYGVGRATRETLGRLAQVPVPPKPLLRLLAGLPPLPIRPEDPRLQLAVEDEAIRVESVDGPFWQKVWSDRDGVAPQRGEFGEAAGPLLSFEFGERRRLDGEEFPFVVRLEAVTAGTRLGIRYETVRLNEPVEADLFDLPRPTDGKTRFLDLGAWPAP